MNNVTGSDDYPHFSVFRNDNISMFYVYHDPVAERLSRKAAEGAGLIKLIRVPLAPPKGKRSNPHQLIDAGSRWVFIQVPDTP